MLPPPPFKVPTLTFDASREVERHLAQYYKRDNPTADDMLDAIVNTVRAGWKLIQCSRYDKLPEDHVKYLIVFIISRAHEKAVEKHRTIEKEDIAACIILSHAFVELMLEEGKRTLTKEDIRAHIEQFQAMSRPSLEPSLN